MASITPLFRANQANFLSSSSNFSPLSSIYDHDDADSRWTEQLSRNVARRRLFTTPPFTLKSTEKERGVNMIINELLSGETSISHNKFQELPNIHLEEQELDRSETELQSIFPDWESVDEVILEEIPMERYHYSRYDLGDESGVREFLTRIDDEEMPSLILPDDGQIIGKKDFKWTRHSDPENGNISNELTNIRSAAEEEDLSSSSSSTEAVEGVTLNKRKLDIYLDYPSYPQSHLAKENAVPRGSVLRGASFDNSATRRLLQMRQHTLEMYCQSSSKAQKIEVKSAPIKRQISLLKPLLSESTSKPKEVEKKPSEIKQTATRLYHGPLKSVTNIHPLGHSSLPEKFKHTALSISNSKDRWFVAQLQSVPANGMLTVPIPSESGSAKIVRLPRRILEHANFCALQKKEAVSFPICLLIPSTSSYPIIVNLSKPTGLIVLADPLHPENFFVGPFPAAFTGQFPSCLVPFNTLS